MPLDHWYCTASESQADIGFCTHERDRCDAFRVRSPQLTSCVDAPGVVCFSVGTARHCAPSLRSCEAQRGASPRLADGAAASECVQVGEAERSVGAFVANAAIATTATASHANPDAKDPAIAGAWSFGMTLGGAALIGAGAELHSTPVIVAGVIGVVVGPTAGHAYANDTFNGWLDVRLTGVAVGIGGPLIACSVSHCVDANLGAAGAAALLLGGGAYLLGSLGEMVTAPSAASDYNHAHHLDARLSVAPVASRAGLVPGMGVLGRF